MMGRVGLYFVVADDQLIGPRNDAGLKLHREQIAEWRWRPTPLSESGMAKDEPIKAFEDTVDSLRFITAEWGPEVTPKTEAERLDELLPKNVRISSIQAEVDPDKRLGRMLAYPAQIARAKRRLRESEQFSHWADQYIPPHRTLEQIMEEDDWDD
jgi:hypothetical protein